MSRSPHRILMALSLAAAALTAGAGEPPATTQPAEATISVSTWTCPRHEQFRMTARGKCPLCQTDLVRRKVKIQGGEAVGDPYPLDHCPVSGKALGSMGDPIVMTYEGREIRFCCPGCIKPFEAGAAEYLEKIDRQIIEQQLPRYPMTTCPISSETLGSMGEPVNYVYNNRLIRFCCKGCLRAFKKDPAATVAALDAAVIAQQGPGYPLETCPISGEKLGAMGAPVDYVIANRLVRFCCTGCATTFYKDPAAYLTKLDKAWATHGEAPHTESGEEHEHEHDHDAHHH